MEEELILEEQDRSKLDGIVSKMEANNEKEEDIKFVVQDFKSKYGKSPASEPDTLKKKEPTQQNGALLYASSDTPSTSGSTVNGSFSESVDQTIDIPYVEADPSLQKLYDGYMKSSTLSDDQMGDISDTITKQKGGDRSWWETTKAITQGFFETGTFVPVYNFDKKEDLVKAKAKKNKIDYLQELPEEDRTRLLQLVQEQGEHLKEETAFVSVQNKALLERSQEISAQLEPYKALSKEQIASLPQEEKKALREAYNESKAIQQTYNDNFDIIEASEDDLGTFEQEIDLLKRNYNGLDNFIGKTINSAKSIGQGLQELFISGVELQSKAYTGTDIQAQPLREGLEQQVADTQASNELLAPSMSVDDIESASDLGEWIAEQTATQLPVITTLVATGGVTGGAILGASTAGNKSLEMKAENKAGTKDYTGMEILLASAGHGALEYLGERVTGGILSKGKRALTAANNKEVKKGIAKKIKSIVGDSSSEAVSEGLTVMGQNAVDRYYLGNKDVGLFDGMEDALASGGVMGGMMSTAPHLVGAAIRPLQSSESRVKVQENTKKIKEIRSQLENENLDPDVKKEMEGLAKNLIKENGKEIKATIDNIESKSAEDLKEVNKINKAIVKEEAKSKKIVDNPDIPQPVREDLSTRMLEKLEKKKARRDEIMDPKNKSNPIPKDIRDEISQQVTEEMQSEVDSQLGVVQETDTNEGQEEISQIVTEEMVDEAESQIGTMEDLSKVDISESLGLDKLKKTLDKWDNDLSDFGKGTLGINIPVEVVKVAVKAMKLAVATAKTAADVTSAGINALKATDWYKGLTPKEQKEAERDILSAPIQKETPTPHTKEKVQEKSPKSFKNELKKLYSGMPIISYIDEQVFEKGFAKPLEKFVTKSVKQGLDSNSKLKRSIAEGYVSLFNGVARTDKEVSDRRRLTGKQESAYVRGSKLTKELQGLIGHDVESAKRVHKVMDPELYDVEDRITYEGLNQSEKDLHDMLREINDATHELNHDMEFIDDETYEKFKGNYIGRGYEVFEDLANEAEKEVFISNKEQTGIYKHRKEIDQWKIDNKVQDPIYLTVNRMIQTERNVAVREYANNLVDQGVAKKEIPKDKKGYTQLNGKAYGKLNGLYVPNYIAEDFKGYFFSNKLMDQIYAVAQTYDKNKIRQFFKKYHTVYSPVVQIGNFMSNHAFAFAAGVNIVQLWGHLPSAEKSLNNKDADYMTLLENGIIGSNVLTPDLTLTDKAQEKLKLDQKKNKYIKKIEGLDEWAQRVYAKSDDRMKVSAFKALKDAGYTQDEAIQRVFEGFQNYATVGKAWDFAAKFPIFGNAYIKFQADLMRIVKNSLTKRPLTTVSFLAGITMMVNLMSEMSGESEEEQAIREARPFIPKIKNPFQDIPLVMRVGNKEINLARYISPYYNYDIPNKDWVEELSGMSPFEVFNFREQEGVYLPKADDVLLGPIFQAVMYNTDFRNKSITDPDANVFKPSTKSIGEKLYAKAEYITRSLVPLAGPLQDLYTSHKYGEDFYGRNKSAADLALSKVVKVQTWNDESLKKTVEKSLKSISYNEKKINTKMRAIQNDFIKKVEKSGQSFDKGEITKEQLDNKIIEAKELAEKRLDQQMEDLVKVQKQMNELILKIDKLGIIDKK